MRDGYAYRMEDTPVIGETGERERRKIGMIDNTDLIEQTGALERLSDDDRAMLAKCGRRLGSTLCCVLRHSPEKIGVSMDKQGWVNVSELIEKFNISNHGKKIYLSMPVLMEMVRTDNKQRYGLKKEGADLMIRCRQGHSIPWLEMDFRKIDPPAVLYHGTITAFLDSIMTEGLKPMSRQHVHLTWDISTAMKVAQRRKSQGKPVILEVDAGAMAADGITFYLSDNDVWLTDCVPPKYLTEL